MGKERDLEAFVALLHRVVLNLPGPFFFISFYDPIIFHRFFLWDLYLANILLFFFFFFPYCRDVLVIGKRFAKERDEMCRQLGRLYEDVTSLHQALLFELRTLHRDLAGVRDRVSSSRKAGEIAEYVFIQFIQSRRMTLIDVLFF